MGSLSLDMWDICIVVARAGLDTGQEINVNVGHLGTSDRTFMSLRLAEVRH